jgi:hypothetical protein
MYIMKYEDSLRRYHKVVKLKEKGATYAEIGKMFGVSRQRIEQILKKGEPQIAEYFGGILGLNGLAHLEGRARARALVRIRDDYTCQDCGLTRPIEEVQKHNSKITGLRGKMKSLDVHHTHGQCGKNSRGYDSTSDISKMITLCHRCHYNRPEHKSNKL